MLKPRDIYFGLGATALMILGLIFLPTWLRNSGQPVAEAEYIGQAQMATIAPEKIVELARTKLLPVESNNDNAALTAALMSLERTLPELKNVDPVTRTLFVYLLDSLGGRSEDLLKWERFLGGAQQLAEAQHCWEDSVARYSWATNRAQVAEANAAAAKAQEAMQSDRAAREIMLAELRNTAWAANSGYGPDQDIYWQRQTRVLVAERIIESRRLPFDDLVEQLRTNYADAETRLAALVPLQPEVLLLSSTQVGAIFRMEDSFSVKDPAEGLRAVLTFKDMWKALRMSARTTGLEQNKYLRLAAQEALASRWARNNSSIAKSIVADLTNTTHTVATR